MVLFLSRHYNNCHIDCCYYLHYIFAFITFILGFSFPIDSDLLLWPFSISLGKDPLTFL